jgi:hypothetical protein
LERALKEGPAKAKLFTELNPEFILRSDIAELIGKYKKSK